MMWTKCRINPSSIRLVSHMLAKEAERHSVFALSVDNLTKSMSPKSTNNCVLALKNDTIIKMSNVKDEV